MEEMKAQIEIDRPKSYMERHQEETLAKLEEEKRLKEITDKFGIKQTAARSKPRAQRIIKGCADDYYVLYRHHKGLFFAELDGVFQD